MCNSRLFSAVLAALALFVQGVLFTASGAIPKKAEASAKLEVVAQFPASVEQGKDIKVELNAKGGTAPYQFTVPNCGPGGASCIVTEGDPQKSYYVYQFGPSEDVGDSAIKVHVTDSKGLEADTDFTIKVTAKIYTTKDIVDAVKGIKIPATVDTTEQLKTINSHLEAVVANTKPGNKESNWGFPIFLLLAFVVLGVLVGRISLKLRNPHSSWWDVLGVLMLAAILMASAPVQIYAATPTFNVTSVTPPQLDKGQAATVVVCGKGMKPSEIEDAGFQGLSVLPTNADDANGCFDFAFDAGSSSKTGEFNLVIKSTKAGSLTNTGKTLKIVESGSAKTPAPAASSAPTATVPTSASVQENDPLFRSFLLGISKACGIEQKQMLKLLRSKAKGTSQQAADSFIACLTGKAKEAVFTDERFTKAVAAVNALNDAMQKGGLDEPRVEQIATQVFDQKIVPIANAMEDGFKKSHNSVEAVEHLAEHALSATGDLIRLEQARVGEEGRGHKLNKPTARSYEPKVNKLGCMIDRDLRRPLTARCAELLAEPEPPAVQK